MFLSHRTEKYKCSQTNTIMYNGFGAGAISRYATQKHVVDQKRGNKMIDEYWTWQFYGYYSHELAPKSNKPIVVRCDDCCQYRIVKKYGYRDLCRPCAHKNILHTEATKQKMSEWQKDKKKPPHTEETKQKMSITRKGKKISPRTDEHRQHLSASGQGISYEDWCGYAIRGEYCEKFDEACRERIRAKYNHKCFICNRLRDDNITKTGKVWKLSVHHVDRNKNQGCDGVQWKLVPLCLHCHAIAHHEPMKSRIEYII